MIIDTVFAKAVEKVAEDQGLSLRDVAHQALKMSTPDVSVREFRRTTRPDKMNRLRPVSLREAYEISTILGKPIDELIKTGLLL